MLATVAPGADSYDETLGTLQYASRAKTITLKARRNESMTEVGKLRKEVEDLKAMLASATASAGEGASEAERARIEEYALQLKQYGEENQKLLQAESEHRALLATHGQESDAL